MNQHAKVKTEAPTSVTTGPIRGSQKVYAYWDSAYLRIEASSGNINVGGGVAVIGNASYTGTDMAAHEEGANST